MRANTLSRGDSLRYTPGMPCRFGGCCSDVARLSNPTFDSAACGVGTIVNLDGLAQSRTVRDGLELLRHLDHRGARGADENTGDGAGMLLVKPHVLFQESVPELPAFDEYGVGQLFLLALRRCAQR